MLDICSIYANPIDRFATEDPVDNSPRYNGVRHEG